MSEYCLLKIPYTMDARLEIGMVLIRHRSMFPQNTEECNWMEGQTPSVPVLPHILLWANITVQWFMNHWSHRNRQTYIIFVEGEVVRGQHPDPQTRAERCVQEAADDCLVLGRVKNIRWKQQLPKANQSLLSAENELKGLCRINICPSSGYTLVLLNVLRVLETRGSSHLHVPATLPEALGEHGDHVFVVVQQLLHQLTETSLHVLVFDLSTNRHTLHVTRLP